MAERSEQRSRSARAPEEEPPVESSLGLADEPAVDTGTAHGTTDESESRGLSGRFGAVLRAPFSAAASRLTTPFEGLFSVRAFLLLFVLTAVGMVVAGATLPPGSVGGLVGIAVVAFAAGLGSEQRRYAEVTLSGGLAAGLSWVLGNLAISVLGAGVPLVAVGIGAGALAGLLGHYFGRDLRDGLTRDLGSTGGP
jgi:hypothetical protein